jgi:4-hydroxy-tetrahydrodipicolinate synthase
MLPRGAVDWGALDRLVEVQIDQGISGLCACGTTAEAATLDEAERDAVILRVVKAARGRVPVLAGTGHNSTRMTIAAQQRAQALGADFGLVVTPYYNKPTPQGLLAHYEAVAQASTLPIIMYNVPSRTGCDMQADIIAQLSQMPQIQGIKEATGQLSRLDGLRAHVDSSFALLSGDDASSCAFVLMGGDGAISVASNVVPKAMSTLMTEARQGNAQAARDQHDALVALFDILFVESNPIVVKAAMALQKQLTEAFRLPLCGMQAANRNKLEAVMQRMGLVP